MASILNEYISKNWSILEFQQELQRLIGEYNKLTGRYLFVYAADINKGRNRGIDVTLVQDDFYTIQDVLRESEKETLDFYIETPGGSGEAAEEIAKFLHKKFSEVNFVVAGEAKSAGTILVLSGDNIHMTETGSLGPIDAQVRVGRAVVSAHDYKEWIDQKRAEASATGTLNPLDAIVVAQISPGEIAGIVNSLEFAKDLVKEWLEKYKFKNWTKTATTGDVVTPEKRKERANEIAELLCNHTAWRTHGRSLKIEDLKEVLHIERIDDSPELANIVYRIKTVVRLIFDMSTIYKVFALEDFKLFKTFSVNPNPSLPGITPGSSPPGITPPSHVDAVEIKIKCPKCRKGHQVNGYLDINSATIKQKKLKINPLVKDNDILICDSCKFAIDLKPTKAQIETQTKRKLSFK